MGIGVARVWVGVVKLMVGVWEFEKACGPVSAHMETAIGMYFVAN